MTCLWNGCNRAAPVVNGTVHAHCQQHESRLLREAFGPQSWTERAAANELPPMVVGGVDINYPDPAVSAAPAVSPERSRGGAHRRARALAAVQAA